MTEAEVEVAESSLQDRLRNHAKAFDGLLSLIPAKMYYGEDTSDQWQRKKQTKAEAAEARRNKLDPDSQLNRSVKEVMDEQARKKRKRDEARAAGGGGGGEDDEWSDVEGVDAETPLQGLKKQKKDKKQKMAAEEPEPSAEELRKEEKKQARKDRKAERQMLREEEAEYERRSIKGVNKVKLGPRVPRGAAVEEASAAGASSAEKPSESIEQDDDDDDDGQESENDMDEVDVPGLDGAAEAPGSDASSSAASHPQSPVFDEQRGSAAAAAAAAAAAGREQEAPSTATTSTDSTVPPSEKPKHIKVPSDTSALRVRLAAKIQALRDARNADREGKPIRTRQELIESRRQKQAERKAHKKEVRQKQKADEDQKREEALASARNSPGSILNSPAVELADTNFAFGRVGFGDGSQLSHDLSHVLSGSGKKKGPQDPKTALQKLEAQKKRVAAMDAEKRKDVEEKEQWLTARRRAEGEKIRDSEKMLKKTIKRKDTAKKKSEKEWSERKEGVAKGMKDRQKKREDNLRKRRDEKLLGKAGKKKGGAGGKKPKGRAGFEGAFKVGGKKK